MLGLRRTAAAGLVLGGFLALGCLEELIPDDSYEPNDSFEMAADISDVSGTNSINANVTYADYVDYFYVDLPAGSLLYINCLYVGEDSEITVTLYDDSTPPGPLADGVSFAGGEELSYDGGGSGVPAGGYYIVVKYWGTNVNTYELTWTLTP